MTNLTDFALAFNRCWLCGTMAIHTWPPSLEIHHIARGVHREKAKDERCAMIRTCQRCHGGHLDGMDIARQLALKLRYDPTGYDRQAVNVLRGRQPDAITEGEVRVALADLEYLSDQNESGFPFPRWKFG